MKKVYQLQFKWSVSRGRDTKGYNICSLYVDGKKVSSCNGGGYDMKGSAFGDWLQKEFQTELKKLNPNDFYGIRVYDDKIYLDGGCGYSSMERIVKALGYSLKSNHGTSKIDNVIMLKND